MLYCTKCRWLCEDSAKKCPNCKSVKLRPAAGEDLAFLLSSDLYAAGRLEEALNAAGIPCRVEDASAGHSYFTFDSEVMPTDKSLYVAYARYEEAKDIAVQVEQALEEERTQEQQEAEPPSAKRLIGEIVSVVGFLLLVMLAVYGADAVAGWLKGLFGMG